MAQQTVTKAKGIILEALPNAQFKVQLESGGEVLAHLSGKMRLYKIKVMPGDSVILEMTEYDQTRGRITYRER
jgi:translation initiation factor IF-1